METFEADGNEVSHEMRLRLRQELCRVMIANGTNTLSGRAMAVLVINGMMKSTPETSLPANLQEIVLDKSHVGRLYDGQGPTLGFDLGEEQRGRIPLKTILWQPTKQLRASALREIEDRCAVHAGNRPLLEPKVLSKLRQLRGQILGDDIQRAMDAVYEAIDLLSNDFFFQVSEVYQTLILNDDDSLAVSLKQALHPSPDAIRFILEHPVSEPRRHEEQIDALAESICETTSDVPSFLNRYYRFFGHLPLAGKWSLGQMLSRFLGEGGSDRSPWNELWTWESEHDSPLASFHVCQALCSNPSWVHVGQRESLLLQIAQFTEIMLGSKRGLRRTMLARHFRRHLETLEYITDGDLVSASALWFAEYVSTAIESSGKERADKAFSQIEREIQRSEEWCTICRPPTTASLLRAGTELCDSVWVTSILGVLSRSELMLSFDEDAAFAISVAPTLRRLPSASLMALETSTLFSLDDPHDLLRSRYDRSSLSSHVGAEFYQFSRNLEQFSDLSETHQLILARDLAALAFQGQAPEEQLYRKLSDSLWCAETLASSNASVASRIFDALREVGLKQNGKDWPRLIPHFCVLACEEEFAKPSPRLEVVERLFGFVVQSCITFNTSSAIDRLFATNQARYRGHAETWIKRLENVGAGAPCWVVAKCRGILAALDG